MRRISTLKYRKKTLKRICTSILCMVLSFSLVLRNEVMTAYALSHEDMGLYRYNKSDQIYKWTRVRSVDQMKTIFEGEGVGRDKRLLLIPAVCHGKQQAPTFENYYYFGEEKDELNIIPLSDNVWIDITKDEFYSQGGFRTPYIEYEGMKYDQAVQNFFGESVPTLVIYTAKKDDTRGTKVLYNAWDVYYKFKQKAYAANKVHELDLEDSEEYHWEIGFPGQHEQTTNTSRVLKGTKYHEYVKDTVMLGVKIVERSDYLNIADNLNGLWPRWCLNYEPRVNNDFWTYTEQYYICYIGVEGVGFNQINDTLTIGNGQTVVLDKLSYLKPKATIEIKEGGTLFVSGEFINSGKIMINGGSMVLQKGALMYSNNTSDAIEGNIYIEGGDLIVREGARMLNFDPKLQANEYQCSLYIKKGGNMINRGLVAVSGDINVWATGELKNQGVLVLGCVFFSNLIRYYPYSPETTDLTVNEFAKKATEEMRRNLAFIDRKYVKLLDINGSDKEKDRGVFRDEGNFYVLKD